MSSDNRPAKVIRDAVDEAWGVTEHAYQSQAARDAQRRGYGGPPYWAYLDRACAESRDHWARKGDPERAAHMMTRTLSEALQGNDGD